MFLVLLPYFSAIAPEMVIFPVLYMRFTSNRPKSGKPIAAPMTDHDAANPSSNAACAVPMVDLAPIYSDISRIPTINAGIAREPSIKSPEFLLRIRKVSQVVNRM